MFSTVYPFSIGTEDCVEQLTERQGQILGFITNSIDERGYPPTLREIGRHFGIRSTNGVNDHLKALEKKGFLSREDLKSRAMRPVSRPLNGGGAPSSDSSLCEVPILGQVAAGEPLLAVENVEDTVKIDRNLVAASQDVFGLRVVGESMIEDGIFSGDFVFVKRTPVAKRGDTVVAMIEGEATVKRYYPEKGKIRFQPANQNMQPIVMTKEESRQVDILGIVVGVYRKL